MVLAGIGGAGGNNQPRVMSDVLISDFGAISTSEQVFIKEVPKEKDRMRTIPRNHGFRSPFTALILEVISSADCRYRPPVIRHNNTFPWRRWPLGEIVRLSRLPKCDKSSNLKVSRLRLSLIYVTKTHIKGLANYWLLNFLVGINVEKNDCTNFHIRPLLQNHLFLKQGSLASSGFRSALSGGSLNDSLAGDRFGSIGLILHSVCQVLCPVCLSSSIRGQSVHFVDLSLHLDQGLLKGFVIRVESSLRKSVGVPHHGYLTGHSYPLPMRVDSVENGGNSDGDRSNRIPNGGVGRESIPHPFITEADAAKDVLKILSCSALVFWGMVLFGMCFSALLDHEWDIGIGAAICSSLPCAEIYFIFRSIYHRTHSWGA